MYDEILRIIDAELDKLMRARQVLTTPDTELQQEPAQIAVAGPETEPMAVTVLPPVRRRSYSARRPRVTPVAAEPAAVRSSIPERPVFVPAASAKDSKNPPPRHVPVPPPVIDGSLDSLIRDLTRSPLGR